MGAALSLATPRPRGRVPSWCGAAGAAVLLQTAERFTILWGAAGVAVTLRAGVPAAVLRGRGGELPPARGQATWLTFPVPAQPLLLGAAFQRG